MKDIKELRDMTSDELKNEIIELRKQQFNLRMKKANGALDKTHHFSNVRKSIARIKTILTEKAGE